MLIKGALHIKKWHKIRIVQSVYCTLAHLKRPIISGI